MFEKVSPAELARSLSTGVLLYILEVIIILSFGALIFSGPLASIAPYGLGLLLVGDAVLCLFVARFSSFPGSIAIAQDAPSAIVAATAAALGAALSPGASSEQLFAAVAVMIAGATLATGVFFLLLGYFRLGGLVRFLPYPVVGGFLAGTGWLLFTGALGVMLEPASIATLLRSENALRWLPGVLLGLVLLVGTARSRSPLVLPGIFFGGVAAFYLAARLAGASPAELSAGGWLMGPFPSGGLWRFPFAPAVLQQVDWPALGAHLGQLVALPVVSVLALLLNATGLELMARRDLDLNRELIVTGGGNLLAGLAGGIAGYHAVSLSGLNLAASGGKRLPALVTALLLILTMLAGAALLAYLPRVALGGLLAFLGLALLHEWVIRARRRLPRTEFAVLLLILAVIAFEGFLTGVLAGLLISVVLFVLSYSRVSVVKHELSGRDFRSRVTRTPAELSALEALGDSIYILNLQGFIFFGTAHGLFELARERARRISGASVRYVLLGFERVSGLDSTGLLSFRKLQLLAQDQGFVLVLAGLSPDLQAQFVRGGLADSESGLQFFPDLDLALEWCENGLLEKADGREAWQAESPSLAVDALTAALLAFYSHEQPVRRLLAAMRCRSLAPGEYLFRQGEPSDSLALVAGGQVTARLENPGRAVVRLETMGSGRAVGEVGFYLDLPRSAAVVADSDSTVYLLERHELERLETEDPEAANAFHRIIIHLLGERVRHLTRAVEALQV